MNKNIIIILAVCVVLSYMVYGYESYDVKNINKYYHEIKHNNECLEYLRNVSQLPIWRIALMASLFLMFVNAVVVQYVVGKTNYTANDKFWTIVVMLFMSTFLLIYKLLAHWQWHYVCDWGCNKKWLGQIIKTD